MKIDGNFILLHIVSKMVKAQKLSFPPKKHNSELHQTTVFHDIIEQKCSGSDMN